MKKIFLCAWLLGAICYDSAAQQKVSITGHVVNPGITSSDGIISEKISLKGNSTPLVKVINIKTEEVDQIPAGSTVFNSFEPEIIRGTERKKQVAFVNIPAYRRSGITLEKLISYDLEITEFEDGSDGNTAQKPTTVPNSVLASGSWYKIGAPTRGVYKIDYNFLQSIGVNPSSINPANIRVYGNGGTVLPEKVSSDQPDDLIENAIYVSNNSGTFGTGDYILFYANGPVRWNKDSVNRTFTHTSNYYENQSYYFLNFDLGAGKRITSAAATGTASFNVSAVDDYSLIDRDSVNLGNMGKVWWGNKMNSINTASLTQTFPINLGAITDTVRLSTSMSSESDATSYILFSYANQSRNFSFGPSSGGNYFMIPKDTTVAFKPGSPAFNVSYKYSTNGTGAGYVDYLRFNYRRPLTFPTGQFAFRDWNTASLPSGQNASYTIQNANSNLKVWETTDPLNPVELNGSTGSGTFTFVRPGNRLREFVSFDGSQFNTPVKLGVSTVANQDLHGLGHVAFLIVTPPEFKAAAEELAQFHRDKEGMTVAVAQTDQIYNEFSSGGQDIGGIRNFIKMFYDRADNEADMIKNVLFMGAASFDYKNRISFNTNFVPTYQTYESANSATAYSSDDFFALLDDGDNIASSNGAENLVDVGTGRIPAFNATEANGAVAKIKGYASPASFGPWKNIVTYVADDRDEGGGMNHMEDCETVSSFYYDSIQVLNVYKIYSDAYSKVSTPSGGRYPMVNKAIDDQVYTGTFFMSYSGHGSPDRWSHEAILTADDYGNWKNKTKLPVIVTATCDFGRFDDPEHRSAGAKLMISPNNGSIAMITTTQIVYQDQNTALNRAYTASQFSKGDNGEWRTLGEALREAKNRFTSSNSNNHKYVVLGDPAMKMEMPVHNVVTDKLEMQDNGSTFETDTIKALGRYLLSGSIKDKNNNLQSNFNGPVYVTIFDKTRKIQTVNPDQNNASFNLQTNMVARVKGTVKNGQFTVSFIAPKDINYEYGLGKISYYANSESTDASGLDTSYTVGDYNRNAVADNDAPVVKPYIDNEKFRDGGVTGPNPLLYVKLFDENGINVSGSSIGHDLVAILDDDLQNPFVMNNYYETEQNDYRKGYVNFPMYNLPDGVHTLRIKAWDAYNNSGEGVVTFEVKNKNKGFISDMYNYPNPVTDMTHIVFQHNQEGEEMDITLQIFNASGALARTLKQNITTTGNRTEILWDGLGENSTPLFRGVYFYRLTARTSKGISATAYQKLVLLR